MARSTKEDDLSALRSSIVSIVKLLQSFSQACQSPLSTNTPITIANPPNPLALLSDASSILKAQTTKLSLLILNKPFTPSAITSILTSLTNECLPALMTTLELCPPATYSKLLNQHIRNLLSQAFRELEHLISSILQDGHEVDKPRGRDPLASTGLLWETCDSMINLGSVGLGAIAVEKTMTYHSLIKDALTELEDWDAEEESDSDFGSEASVPISPQTQHSSVDGTASSTIKLLLGQSLILFFILIHLPPFLLKRRLPSFPPLTSQSTPSSPSFPSTSHIQALDAVVRCLAHFSAEADEIAGALYASDEKTTLSKLKALKAMAVRCAQADGIKQDWTGEEDAESAVIEKWIARVNAVDVGVETDEM